MKNIYITLFFLLVAVAASAFNTGHYAQSSVLADGRWVKIGVPADGVYRISSATLRKWGFDNPERVRIYGYGGRRAGDALTESNYPDDLPLVQSVTVNDGVVFYGAGPGRWMVATGIRYRYDINVYSNAGYYFVTEADSVTIPPIPEISRQEPASANPLTTCIIRAHHEKELVTPGKTSGSLVGEDFMRKSTHTVTFDTPGITSDALGWFECSFVSAFSVSGSRLDFSVNGTKIPTSSSDKISSKGSSSYVYGVETVTRHTFSQSAVTDGRMAIEITLASAAPATMANLNYLSVNYQRTLSLPATGMLAFSNSGSYMSMSDAVAGTVVWDVTDPRAVKAPAVTLDGSTAAFSTPYSNMRDYVAWYPGAALPEPDFVENVACQDLHSHIRATPADMVIVTPRQFRAQAQRLADFHAASADSLSVAVVTDTEIYNEFGSGSPDITAIRKYLKAVYDLGTEQGRPLRYVLLMGRTTYDNRRLTPEMQKASYPTLPAWMPNAVRTALSDNEGYNTDDFIAMLADGSGSDMGLDDLTVAVGRIPVTNEEDARQVVDKIIEYARGRNGAWKQRAMLLADDEDRGIHLQQSEDFAREYLRRATNPLMLKKVYMDAYLKEGTIYPGARQSMFRNLDEGIVWWTYIGHANVTGWTHEGQLSYKDLNAMYLRHLPFIYAATCDFLRWDAPDISGAEILFAERYGGAIGVISATRPVFISDNGMLTAAMGRALAAKDSDGGMLTMGEIYRRAKNNILNSRGEHRSNTNRLRYVFLGDPALRLATPANTIALTAIGDTSLPTTDQIILSAGSKTTFSGEIRRPDGSLMDDFDGIVQVEVMDAEQSITTYGNGDGVEDTFQDYGSRIYSGAAHVNGGRFDIDIAVPVEIAQNFRPATAALYAYSTNGSDEATALASEFYVYGYDDGTKQDTTPPEIHSLALNIGNEGAGSTVNSDPMLLAEISDDTGINLSGAGIGHQMTAIVDGNITFSDLSLYYTPYPGTPPGGKIAYPMSGLTDGAHTLTLRVWDTAANATSKTIDFYVDSKVAPVIVDCRADANPAHTETNFYISHDRPDSMVEMTVEVFNLMGKPVWSASAKGRSDMFDSMPVNWNLCDNSGRRVPRGIYVYRASISTDGQTYTSASRRLAVAGN